MRESCFSAFYLSKYICILSLSQIENLEDLLKEKDNQLELARSKLNAVQAQTYTSEGTLTSLEEALADRDKQGRDSECRSQSLPLQTDCDGDRK